MKIFGELEPLVGDEAGEFPARLALKHRVSRWTCAFGGMGVEVGVWGWAFGVRIGVNGGLSVGCRVECSWFRVKGPRATHLDASSGSGK